MEFDAKMFRNLKYLLVGGEAYSLRHFKAARESNPDLIFIHVYGPTENTTFSTYYQIKDMSLSEIPIGYPISNSTCYVVSKNNKLQPIRSTRRTLGWRRWTIQRIFKQRRINN